LDYQEILAKIQQDVNNDLKTDLYRYNGILEAISFFSNRLTYEQITHAAFDFVNELLTVNKSVLYLLQDNHFAKVKSRNLPQAPDIIPLNAKLKDFAVYVGNVVSGRNRLEAYFAVNILDKTEANLMIPLMLGHRLSGFILMSGRVSSDFNENDVFVSETLMNLFNNALESSSRLEELQKANRELDEKIFSLFAINQSAKAMLTEHRLDELNQLAVDVFSELTLSASTGFFLYDKKSEKYVLKAYRDVFHSDDEPSAIYLTLRPESKVQAGKQIVDISEEKDIAYFSTLFMEGAEPLSALKARYVVFIFGKGGELLGFVTLGETISGAEYKQSTFELVDSLASYTYIALSNAMLIQVVNDQKKLLEMKLERLITLNQLIKNINSAQTCKQLIDLALETLTVSLGVENALIALYKPEDRCFTVSAATNGSFCGLAIPITPRLELLQQGKTIFESDATLVSEYIGREIANALPERAGLLVIPMYLDLYEIRLIGAIFIFNTRSSILSEEENILTFETIANHMAPLIDGFMTLDRRKREYIPDVKRNFITEVRIQIEECLQYHFDLEIIRLVNEKATPFTEDEFFRTVAEHFRNAYAVAYNHTYVVIHNEFDYNRQILERLADEAGVSITSYRLYKDFNTYEELMELLK